MSSILPFLPYTAKKSAQAQTPAAPPASAAASLPVQDGSIPDFYRADIETRPTAPLSIGPFGRFSKS